MKTPNFDIPILKPEDIIKKPNRGPIIYHNDRINVDYNIAINRFLKIIKKPIEEINLQDINNYLEIRKKELKPYSFDQTKFALNFFAREIKSQHPEFITSDITLTITPEPNIIHSVNITDAIKIRGLAKTTGYGYYRKLLQLNDYLGGKSEYDITIPDLQNFINYKINSGLNSKTIHIYKNAFEFYFNLKNIKLDFDQLILPKITGRKLPVTLTKGEIKRLVEATDEEYFKLLIELCYGSGLRVSELINVKYVDFNFEEKTLKVTWEGAKGKKERFTVVSELFIKHYFHYLEYMGEKYAKKDRGSERPLFNYHPYTINRKIKYFGKRAGINKKIHTHSLRHSFATHYYIDTRDLLSLSKLLGHESISMTTIYVDLAGEYIQSGKSPLDVI